jgi:hypothetical protein
MSHAGQRVHPAYVLQGGLCSTNDHLISKLVTLTELPISAKAACALGARKQGVVEIRALAILRATDMGFPDHIDVGAKRLGTAVAVRDHPRPDTPLTVKPLDAKKIDTIEHGGPVRSRIHCPTFTPLDQHRCRHTDEVETDHGWRDLGTRPFIRGIRVSPPPLARP